jgi:hypothetical protein
MGDRVHINAQHRLYLMPEKRIQLKWGELLAPGARVPLGAFLSRGGTPERPGLGRVGQGLQISREKIERDRLFQRKGSG